jgi:hypothetical protein
MTDVLVSQVPVAESSPEDLELQRMLLDLLLQPLDRWDGFENLRAPYQFGPGVRFQLEYAQWALALAQYTRTPAFSGYLREAQANAITKMLDKRVWKYWAIENLIGYRTWNPDPIVHHNIMYSAYLGVMVGTYEMLNDGRFSEDGALTLTWSAKKQYRYDFRTLSETIRRNMLEAKKTMYPCEPYMVFPICNTYALNTMRMHDRLHGTDHTGDLVACTERSLNTDFKTDDGRIVTVRGPFGIGGKSGVGNDTHAAYWFHSPLPEEAEAALERLRASIVELPGGKLTFEGLSTIDRRDPGSMRASSAVAEIGAAMLAKEMGDPELAARIRDSLHVTYKDVRSGGARRLDGVSVHGNAMYAMLEFGRPGGMRDLIEGRIPSAWAQGPRLAGAAYPEVLVAKAVSPDGRGLELVLRPGAGEVRTTLEVGGLVPSGRYDVTGGIAPSCTADANGSVLVEIDLDDRHEVRITPAV